MESRRYLQVLAMMTSLVTFVGLVTHSLKVGPNRTRILYAPITYLFHVFVYYATVLLSQEAIDLDHYIFGFDLSFHWWSAGVSLHSVITILFLAYAATKSYK